MAYLYIYIYLLYLELVTCLFPPYDYKLLKVINHKAFKFLAPYSIFQLLGSEKFFLNE